MDRTPQSQKKQTNREPDDSAESKRGHKTTYWQDMNVLLNFYFSEHWIGLTVVACAICCFFIYLATINMNPLWWVCIGTILIADLLIFVFFTVVIQRTSAASSVGPVQQPSVPTRSRNEAAPDPASGPAGSPTSPVTKLDATVATDETVIRIAHPSTARLKAMEEELAATKQLLAQVARSKRTLSPRAREIMKGRLCPYMGRNFRVIQPGYGGGEAEEFAWEITTALRDCDWDGTVSMAAPDIEIPQIHSGVVIALNHNGTLTNLDGATDSLRRALIEAGVSVSGMREHVNPSLIYGENGRIDIYVGPAPLDATASNPPVAKPNSRPEDENELLRSTREEIEKLRNDLAESRKTEEQRAIVENDPKSQIRKILSEIDRKILPTIDSGVSQLQVRMQPKEIEDIQRIVSDNPSQKLIRLRPAGQVFVRSSIAGMGFGRSGYVERQQSMAVEVFDDLRGGTSATKV